MSKAPAIFADDPDAIKLMECLARTLRSYGPGPYTPEQCMKASDALDHQYQEDHLYGCDGHLWVEEAKYIDVKNSQDWVCMSAAACLGIEGISDARIIEDLIGKRIIEPTQGLVP